MTMENGDRDFSFSENYERMVEGRCC
jgi:hypothetical protein